MTGPLYRLYRLNFVDRSGLFDKPVVQDDEVLAVFTEAAQPRHDLNKRRTRHGYRWSVRDVIGDQVEDLGRTYIIGVFSLETLYRTGPIVEPKGMTYGVSEINPPMAIPVRFFLDLKRHLIAFEDVSAVMQNKTGWQKIFELILSSASHSAGFTSRIELEPIAPRQAVEARLASFDRVTRIRLTLRIPNPDLSPTFAKLYDELEKGGIRELTEDMRSERGLSFASDSIPRMAIDMALNGYRKGDVRIYGMRDGKGDRFTIADDVARIDLRETRAYIAGMEIATTKTGEKRLLSAILSWIDETLDPGRTSKTS